MLLLLSHSNCCTVKNIYFPNRSHKSWEEKDGCQLVCVQIWAEEEEMSSWNKPQRSRWPPARGTSCLGPYSRATFTSSTEGHQGQQSCRPQSLQLEERSRSSLRHGLDAFGLFRGLLPVRALESLSNRTPHSALLQAVWGHSRAPRVCAGHGKALNDTALQKVMGEKL